MTWLVALAAALVFGLAARQIHRHGYRRGFAAGFTRGVRITAVAMMADDDKLAIDVSGANEATEQHIN
ncbi:MAG TPA: hypothetical protein VHG72_14070 [Polyangia bacterium]|nr:hypothetical protein [Polyangia bacterium]